jgi:hypothetical protein
LTSKTQFIVKNYDVYRVIFWIFSSTYFYFVIIVSYQITLNSVKKTIIKLYNEKVNDET